MEQTLITLSKKRCVKMGWEGEQENGKNVARKLSRYGEMRRRMT